MKVSTATVLLLHILHVVKGRRYTVISELCQPCGGSNQVDRPGVRLVPSHSDPDVCRHTISINQTIANLKFDARIQLYRLVTEAFDGEEEHLEREYLDRGIGHCSLHGHHNTPQHDNQMLSIYSNLVNLHTVMTITESHHFYPRCSVDFSGARSGLVQAMCDIRLMMPRTRVPGFQSMCQRTGCVNMRGRGCVAMREHTYRALRYMEDVLSSVSQGVALLRQEWDC